jgi:aryl-alcohol dehydrogenase-like predicted oxidoreductase
MRERVIFGCGRLGGGIEFKRSARTIEFALKSGVRHFDTAPSYGLGLSENVLGEVLGNVKGISITTKVGLPRPTDPGHDLPRYLYRRLLKPVLAKFPRLRSRIGRSSRATVANYREGRREFLTRDYVLREIEESLARLKRTYLDVYLVHEPDQFLLGDEIAEVFRVLVAEGVIGRFGLAYGDQPDPKVQFGSVLQQRYRGVPPVANEVITSYLHGVLRYSLDKDLRAGAILRAVLSTCPTAKVIFSASSRTQIQQLMTEVY